MKLVSVNKLEIAKQSLLNVCLTELNTLRNIQLQTPYADSKVDEIDSFTLLVKINALILYTLDNIKVLQPCLKESYDQDGNGKKREFKIFEFLDSKSSEAELELHETFLINCVDTVCGPAVSIVLMMYVLGDIDVHVTVAALREAYCMDLTYRITGWPILYFKRVKLHGSKSNTITNHTNLTPFANDCYSMQTATFFQRVFKKFDVTQVRTVEGKYNTEFYVSALELRPADYVNDLKLARSRYISTFIADYYEPFERQRLQDNY